jgi:glycerol-1-phosphate dehydrogenase [NAD(P)+]
VDACVDAWGSLEDEQQRAKDVYKDFPVPMLGYTEMTKKYNDKETVRKQLTAVKENWPELKERLQGVCYTHEKMKAMFAAAGAPTDPADIGVSREQLRHMVDFVQLMRWRINLLDLAKRGCFYDELLSGVFGKGGAWEI